MLDALRSFKERKLMRRFAAVMNHRSAGLQGERDGRVGRPRRPARRDRPADGRLRRRVSHCYRRPTYDDWPYSVFTMVHGRSARDCEATIEAIRDETGVDEYCLLWSVKEYKKVRLATSPPSGTTGAPSTSQRPDASLTRDFRGSATHRSRAAA